jgi:hypothetical protein
MERGYEWVRAVTSKRCGEKGTAEEQIKLLEKYNYH